MSSPSGYNRLSVITHWLAAISVIALFFTHEGPRDSLAFQFHVAGGAVIGLFLIWRTFHRVARGFPEKPQQHVLLNLLSTIVLWGLILAVIVLVITGYLLPWTIGRPIDFGGVLSIPSPFQPMRGMHEFMEQAHDIAGHIIVPLVLLHVAGALKHWLFDKGDKKRRMLGSDAGGR